MKTLFAAACFAFLLLNAAGVESRKCRCDDDDDGDYDSDKPSYNKLFVFGDGFADTGNLLKGKLEWETRGWYDPSGISDDDHDHKPTGRCSDGMVQSDFLAKIMGQKASPPPERVRREDDVDVSSGMNFACAGSGVLIAGQNLDTQIDRFRKLIRHKIIDKDLSQSIALVAVSGDDYSDDAMDGPDMDPDHITNVTNGIVDGVRQLQDLGIHSVMVNLLPPLGCQPLRTRANKYAKCGKDKITHIHNKNLMSKLGHDRSVLPLDLNAVFKRIVTTKTEKLFYHRHTPCCESVDDDGFCGLVDGEGNPEYTLCDKPEEYFYWDSTNPTQAGWKAVMEQLEGTIKDFLGI